MKVALRSLNGRFLSAENGGDDQGVVHANRTAAGPWEEWELVPIGAPAPPDPSTPAGGIFPLKGCSDFRLLQRHMAGEDIRSIVDERLACGADILRVFGMKSNNTGWDLLPQRRADYDADLRSFLDRVTPLARVYFTVFADTRTVMPNRPEQLAWFDRVVAVLRPYAERIVLELCNEYSHPTQAIDPRAFQKPDGLVCSRGSGQTDEDPASPYWDLAGYSARRNAPPDARGITNYGALEFQAEYPPRVPKFAQEGMKPDDYRGDPAVARLMGRHAALGCGGFFHSNAGVDSRPFREAERTCAAAFFQGIGS